jgi:hypothetical protein
MASNSPRYSIRQLPKSAETAEADLFETVLAHESGPKEG